MFGHSFGRGCEKPKGFTCTEASQSRSIGAVSSGPRPVPMMNVINGGRHAGNALPMQDY